jgi:hypothetical protein
LLCVIAWQRHFISIRWLILPKLKINGW